MRLDSVTPDAIRAESRPIDYDFLPLLVDSILDLGILSPIGIGPDMTLYYGAHRLAAAKEIGLERVPVVVLDTVQDRLDYLKVERDENAVRRTVKTTEQAELYREILELEQAAARQRMSDGGKGEKISHPSDEDREVRVSVTSKPVRAKDEAARAATGHPGRAKTLDKVLAVMDAAADESQPQSVATAAREALKEIESTGKVDAAYKRVKAAQKPVPTGTEANRLNAIQSSKSIGNSLEALQPFTFERGRDRIVNEWWPLGQSQVPPEQAMYFTPTELRKLAQGLTQTAALLEAQHVN